MRNKDGWRVIGILPEPLRGREDLTFEEVVPAITREAGAHLSFRACHWFSTYRIHHRAAARFRDRRCFLLGDAAHVHSPMGAQGMNTGLQDAYNLAWKLALVVKGAAHATLLDTYEAERKPVAERLLRSTDRAFELVVSNNWLASLFRTQIIARVAAFAMTIERVRRIAFRTISQIGIRYRSSVLSQTLDGLPATSPRAGDRFPWLRVRLQGETARTDLFERLDDTGFNLLVIGQDAPSLDGLGLLRTHVIPADADNAEALARAGIRGPAFYLLRPDGHVGLAGTHARAADVAGYFDRCLTASLAESAAASASGRAASPGYTRRRELSA
jgi:hypothetical protein